MKWLRTNNNSRQSDQKQPTKPTVAKAGNISDEFHTKMSQDVDVDKKDANTHPIERRFVVVTHCLVRLRIQSRSVDFNLEFHYWCFKTQTDTSIQVPTFPLLSPQPATDIFSAILKIPLPRSIPPLDSQKDCWTRSKGTPLIVMTAFRSQITKVLLVFIHQNFREGTRGFDNTWNFAGEKEQTRYPRCEKSQMLGLVSQKRLPSEVGMSLFIEASHAIWWWV